MWHRLSWKLDECEPLLENKHSTDVESPPPPSCVCTRASIPPEGKSCSDDGSSACSQEPSLPGARPRPAAAEPWFIGLDGIP